VAPEEELPSLAPLEPLPDEVPLSSLELLLEPLPPPLLPDEAL
jgi:hypothetical protein